MSSKPEVPIDVLRPLYAEAAAFRDLAPWKTLNDADVFGIVDSNSGQTGYCCVMGILGEVLGMAIYTRNGLVQHLKICALPDPEKPDVDEIVEHQDHLMVEFVDHRELDSRDRKEIKTLGFTFRGKRQYPQFRCWRPSSPPWYIDESEARFMTNILHDARALLVRLKAHAPVDDSRNLIKVFVRAEKDEFTLKWETAPADVEDYLMGVLDVGKAKEIQNTCARGDALWEADYFRGPAINNEGPRPFFATAAIVCDAQSGMILTLHLSHPTGWRELLTEQLLAVMEKGGAIPKVVRVRSEKIAAAVQPLCDMLGIELVTTPQLQAVIPAKQHFKTMMSRG